MGWRWRFYINISVGAIAMTVVLLLLFFSGPKRKASEATTKAKSSKLIPFIAVQAFLSKKDMPVGNDRYLLQQSARRETAEYLD